MKPSTTSDVKPKPSPISPVSPVSPVVKPKPVFNVAGSPISSGFGRQDTTGARTIHLGNRDASYDSYGKQGSPISAFGSGGTVSNVVSKGTGREGNFVEVDYGGGVKVRYYHMAGTSAKMGQKVSEKDVLGTMGASGYSPSGSHASYKFLKDDKVVPANVAFPDATFPEAQWGKQGGGSWSDATSFDPKTTTFFNGDKALNSNVGSSRSGSFNYGTTGATSGVGQQVNLGALNQMPMRKRVVSSSPVNTTSFAQPTVPLTNNTWEKPTNV